MKADGDLLKIFGFDSLECRNNPVDVRPPAQKHKVSELRGLGEVREMPPRRDYVHEGW